MPTVDVANARVHYTSAGTGPALVLVHGTGSAGAELTWGRLTGRFTDRRTVIAPDLSGTDRTVDDGAPLTVTGLAEQVVAVIEDTAGPADLLGFSMGAPVAAAVAATRPDLVRRLVLVAGWAHTDGDEYLRNLFTLWRRLGDLHAAIPRSSHTEIDTGHVAFFEKPDEFAELVRDFILPS